MPLGARVIAKVALLPIDTVAALFVWVIGTVHRTREASTETARGDLMAAPQA